MILRGREILAAGTWPGSETFTIDEDGLDDLVHSFNALRLSGKVPLKLGHEDADIREGTRQFSLGWVTRIWREGRRLLADMDVPKKVFDVIQDGYLKFVSVELSKNVKAFNREIPLVLDAVALLGTDAPAVGILKDLQTLTFARRAFLGTGGSRVTLKRGTSTNEDDTMDEKDVAKAVQKALEAALPDAVAKETAPLKVQLKAAEDRATKAEEETKKTELKHKREQIDLKFNAAIEAGAIEPKVRESYIKMTKYDKNDVNVAEIDLKEVDDYIKENTNEDKVKAKAKADAKGKTQTGEADDDADKPSDVRLLNRVRKVCATRGKDPNDAAIAHSIAVEILREDKVLAKAYQTRQEPEAADKGGK